MKAWPPPTTIAALTATDYWTAEVAAGRAFVDTALLAPAGGQFACFQLMNPAGSTITVSLYAATMPNASGSSFFTLRRYDTQLATDVGAGVNLLAGGAAAQAHFRTENPAAKPGTILAYAAQNTNPSSVLSFPFWLGTLVAGQGLLIVTETVALGCACSLYWREG